MFMILNDMSLRTTLWLNNVFLLVYGQQWSSLAQMNEIYQDLATQVFVFSLNLLIRRVTYLAISHLLTSTPLLLIKPAPL